MIQNEKNFAIPIFDPVKTSVALLTKNQYSILFNNLYYNPI